METLLIIGLLAGVAAMVYFMLLRRPKCPYCGMPKVPGRSQCPYCGLPYHPTFPGRAPSPPPNAPRLICLQGPQSGQEFPLTSPQFTIGRSSDNALRMEELLVSRHHAQISFQEGQYILYDCESTNGTYVNERRVAHHLLQPSDRIQIGPSVFAFQIEEAAPPRPMPRPAPTPSPPPIPARVALDSYSLTTISRGGMALVYKGISQDGSTVAIKVLHHTDPYLRDKFEQEGRLGKALHHPHIAQIYDYGTRDGTFYIIMEYVDNGSLRDRLRPGKPFPLDFVTLVIGQTCEALSYAHSRGIIHRDIKPENIMFSSKEGVKIVDFGIAKVTSSVTRTSEGMIVGTPYYMSYEQAKGERVDPRSDIYSLGAVLYEAVTGRVPFTGEPLEVIHKHLTEEPIPPRRINPSLSSGVETVVMRALSKDRSKRFQTAAEMAKTLGYTGTVPSPEPYVYGVREERRKPWIEWRHLGKRKPAAVARLVVISGGGKGRRIPLTSQITVLRRRDVDPNDLLISRKHAQIIQQGGQFWLEDLGSTNGTYLNGHRIFDRLLLEKGDKIWIGDSVLRFGE